MPRMSMINQFTAARANEYSSSGTVPCVAVLGYHDFDTLAGELNTMFGLHLDHVWQCAHDRIVKCEYDGVSIFRSASTPHGIMIGSPCQ